MNIIFRKDIISLVNFFLILGFKIIHKQSDLMTKVLHLKRIVETNFVSIPTCQQ